MGHPHHRWPGSQSLDVSSLVESSRDVCKDEGSLSFYDARTDFGVVW